MRDLPPCWISSGPDHCPQPRVDIPLRNQLYSALRRLPSEQHALVVDVGANDGLFSLNLMHLAERVPPTGAEPLPAQRRATQPPDSLARRISLVLIEPQRSVSRSLQRLAARYDGSEHWPVAAWTRDANLTLHADRNSVRSSLLFAPDTGRHRSDEYTVPAIDLASHLHREIGRRRPALLLLKIDVEVCLVALTHFSPPTLPDWHQALPCSTSPTGPAVNRERNTSWCRICSCPVRRAQRRTSHAPPPSCNNVTATRLATRGRCALPGALPLVRMAPQHPAAELAPVGPRAAALDRAGAQPLPDATAQRGARGVPRREPGTARRWPRTPHARAQWDHAAWRLQVVCRMDAFRPRAATKTRRLTHWA